MQMMRVPFDRKPRPDGTKPTKEKSSARYWRIGRLPSRQSIKQASKQILFDERQGDFMEYEGSILIIGVFHFDEGSICMSVPILI